MRRTALISIIYTLNFADLTTDGVDIVRTG